MPRSNEQIDAILAEFTDVTDAQELLILRQARIQLLIGIQQGNTVVEIEIRQRRTRWSDPTLILPYLDKRIASLQAIVDRAGATAGSSRNFAKFTRSE
jgi:hypothetical protein